MSNTITLPGGITLTLPQALPPLGQQAQQFGQLLGNQQLNLPTLTQGTPPDLSGLITALTPVISAAVPQLAPFLPIIGVLFQVAHALKTQAQGSAPGTNPALETVDQAFWTHVLQVFAPHPPQATPTPTQGVGA